MMSKCKYQDFRIALVDDDGVGETSEYQTFDAARSCCAGHGCQGDDFFFKQIESRIDSLLKFCAETGAFLFIPPCGLGCFI